MNLYQAGYTRRGGQGEGAGWSIVAPSEEMSRIAIEGFRGISGNLVELVNRFSMPKSAIGLFAHDRFLFYLHINYAVSKAEAADARGVAFVHGYSFSLEDNYILCQNPEMLLGVTDQTFQKNYDASIKAYPVVQKLPYQKMDNQLLRKKYQLYTEEYQRLLLGATCALEGYADPLCIKISCPLEEYQSICLEIVNLILSGLPYHLRAKATFFSYKGGKTMLYFSDQAEGNNYFDLDTMTSFCESDRLQQYQFLQLYALEREDQRQRLWQGIAEFVDQAFLMPRREIHCEQIEHGYQANQKYLTGRQIAPDRVIGLLCSFINSQQKQSKAAEEYLTELLDAANQSGQIIEDTKMLHRIKNQIKNRSNPSLQKAWGLFYARQILTAEKQTGQEQLFQLYQEDKKQHQTLMEAIAKLDKEYYNSYYEKTLMPQLLDQLTDIFDYLEENRDSFEEDPTFDLLLQKTTEKEINHTENFTDLWEVRKKADKVAKRIAEVNKEYAQKYLLFTDYLFWKRFSLSWFSPKEIENYKSCSLNKLVSLKSQESSCEMARTVKQLIKVYESIETGNDMLIRFFLTDEITSEIAIKEILQEVLQNDNLEKRSLKNGFDLSLLCYYQLKTPGFDAAEWAKAAERQGYHKIFHVEQIEDLIKNSNVLKNRKFKKIFAEAIIDTVEQKTWRKRQDITPAARRGLRHYERYFTAKSASQKQKLEEQERYCFSFHKAAVGYLPFFSLLFFLLCLKQYSEIPDNVVLGISIAFAVGFTAVWIVKIKNSGGIGTYLAGIGITIKSRLAKLFLFELLLLLSTGAAVFFWNNFPLLQEEPFYRKTAVGAVIMGIYIFIATVGAVWESFKRKSQK